MKKKAGQLHYGWILLSCLLFAGCTYPRMVVFTDGLPPEEHINLGVIYEKRGELDSALVEYKKASPKLPQAYLYMGNIYFRKAKWDKAEEFYIETINKMPRNADAYNNLAWLYYTRKENLGLAELLALKALELDPIKEELYMDTLTRIKDLQLKKDQ